jgi:putative sterol carrier protein
LKEWFEKLPGLFHPERALEFRATLQFRLDGEGGGDWLVTIADQRCLVSEGAAETADATVTASAADWRAVVEGRLDAGEAYSDGRVKVRGDLALAGRCVGLFA